LTSDLAYIYAFIGTVVNVTIIWIGRRLLLRSLNVMSAFLVAYMVFNYLGGIWAVLSPIEVSSAFGATPEHGLITPKVIEEFAVLLGGSLLVFLAGYGLPYGYQVPRSSKMSRMPPLLPSGVSVIKVLGIGIGALTMVGMLMGKAPILLIFQSNATGRELMEARLAYTTTEAQPYLFFLLSFTVLPFTTWLLYGMYLQRKTLLWGIIAYIFIGASSLALASSLQKRPLLLHIIVLLLLRALVKTPLGKPLVPRLAVLIKVGILAIGVLVALFFLFTGVGRSQGSSTIEAVPKVLALAIKNLIIPFGKNFLYYVAIFPSILPHYGFGNIALFSRITGGSYFSDSREVYAIMYPESDLAGGTAVSVFGWLYGGFGILGLLVGAWIIGVLVAVVDRWLDQLPIHCDTLVLRMGMGVFGFYLAHASLFQALMGYGGIPFLVTWLLVRKRVRRLPRSHTTLEATT